MKVAILGAGAIGGFMGASLAGGGAEVHLLARGAHLEAIRRDGLRLVAGGESTSIRLPATDDARDIGPVDFVILGVKSYAYASIGDLLQSLLHDRTAIVPAQNGIPWWYFYRHGGPHDGRRIECVDPGGAVSAVIASDRVVGCVVYPAAVLVAPGVIEHVEGRRVTIGEPDRTISARCQDLSAALAAGGLRCAVEQDIRVQIWVKLMGNAAFNPISALTGATMAQICQFPPTRDLAAQIMREVETVAASFHCELPISVERRLAGAERVGEHRTSMLQDLQAGRRMEVEALLGAVVELAELGDVPAPCLSAIYATVSLRASADGRSVIDRPSATRTVHPAA